MNGTIKPRLRLFSWGLGMLTLLFGLSASAGGLNLPFVNDGGSAAGGIESPVISTSSTLPESKEVSEAAWSPDGKYVAAGFNGLTMGVWNTATHRRVRTLRIDNAGGDFGAIAYSPDGRYLAAGQSVISLWNAKTGAWVRNITAPFIDPTRPQPIGVHSLAFSPDGKTLAALYSVSLTVGGHIDSDIVFYRVDTGKLRDSVRTKDFVTTSIYFTPDGKYLVDGGVHTVRERNAVGKFGKVRYKTYVDIRDAASGKRVRRISHIHTMAPTALALSADGKMIATGTDTGDKESVLNDITHTWQHIDNRDPIRIWDFASGRLLKELFGGKTASIISLAFSPNGKYLAACQWDKHHRSIWIWHVASGRVAAKVETPKYDGTPLSCAFSPGGSRPPMSTTTNSGSAGG